MGNRRLGLAAWLGLAAATAAGQGQPGLDRGAAAPGFGLTVGVPSVQLYPVVRQGGRYVRRLTAGDFLVLDQGRPVAIDSLDDEVCSLSVALLIDVSDSMADKLARVQDAACRFVDELGADDQVTVVAFNHGVSGWAPTRQHEMAKATIRGLRAGGGTAIFDTVQMVVDRFLSPLDRNVIVLFTDGRDQTRALPSQVARRARERGVIVYTLHVPEPVLHARSVWGMRLLADWTGGEDHLVSRPERLDATFLAILDDLRAQYRLTFTPAPGPTGERQVEVRTRDPRQSVRCRERYLYDAE